MSHLKLEHLLKQSCKVQHLLTRRQLMVDGVINTVFNEMRHTTLHLKTGIQTSKQYYNKATATWIPNEASEKYH